MPLIDKPDWEQIQQRYTAWWAGEALDRCIIAVYAPRNLPGEPPPLPARAADRWTDHDFLAGAVEYFIRQTYYGGDAFPIWHPGFPGWASHGVFLGAPVTLAEETGWVYPMLDKGELTDYDYHDLQLQKSGAWWQKALDMLRFTASESKRLDAFPCIGAFGACGDTLAALRGSEQLLCDVLDCPEYVREFDLYLMRQWCDIYASFLAVLRESDAVDGTTCWFDLWSPGKFYAAQNDFAYMISPRAFREIFLPVVEIQTQFLDHTIYHVDGIGNYAHIDALCELPRLQALQILPGAGKPSPLHYMPELKKVQAAGKNLHITIPADEVETALRELSVKGLYLATRCSSVEEAEALLANVKKWSRERVVK